MFDQVETYSGNLIHSGRVASEDGAQQASSLVPKTADEILEAARIEAAGILELAKQEAEAIKQAAMQEAETHSDETILKNAVAAANQLRLDLFCSKSAMVSIVSDALESILGPEKNSETALCAIENALTKVSDQSNLTISVSRKTADRLNLIAVGSGRPLEERGINLVIDPSIEDDRTVLDSGFGKIEIGLKSQLEAFKQVFETEARKHASQAQREINRGGKLA